MFLIILLAYLLYALTSLASTEIPITEPRTIDYLQECVSKIGRSYVKLTDLIFFLNLNKQLGDLRFNLMPTVNLQKVVMENLIPFRFVKADAYIITISEALINNTLQVLAKTSEWNSRARFIVILNGDPSILFQALEKHFVFNVVALVWKLDKEIEVFSYFPYDLSVPEVERAKAVLLDVCLDGKLEKNVNLFPDKLPRKWTNMTVRVAMFEFPPYVVCPRCEESQQIGIEINLIRLVRDILGFNLMYVNKSYISWGIKQPDGSYGGAYGDLQTHNADIGIGVFYMNSSEKWDFDLSYPYLEDSSKWAVPTSKHQPRWESILNIFSWRIWILILTSFIVTSLALYFLVLSTNEQKIDGGLPGSLLISFKSLLGQPTRFLPKTVIVRTVFATWIFFICLISTAFQSQLITVLNFDMYVTQISNEAEMIDAKLQFGFYKSAKFMFSNPESKTESYIYQHFVHCSLNNDCLERVARKGDFATLRNKRYLQYMISNYYLAPDGRPLIYIFDDNVMHGLITMAFSKGFPMFDRVNKLLLDIKSSGMVEFYYKSVAYLADKARMEAERVVISADDLNLDELQGVFALLILGWFWSFMVFVLELTLNLKILRSRSRSNTIIWLDK